MLIFWPQSGWLRSCQLSNMSWNSTLYGWSFYWIQRDSCLSESSWWAPWTLTLRALSRSLCLSLCCLYETLMFDPAQGGDRSAVRCLQWSSKQSRQPLMVVYLPGMEQSPPFPPFSGAGARIRLQATTRPNLLWCRLCLCVSSNSNRKAAIIIHFYL